MENYDDSVSPKQRKEELEAVRNNMDALMAYVANLVSNAYEAGSVQFNLTDKSYVTVKEVAKGSPFTKPVVASQYSVHQYLKGKGVIE